MATTYTAAPGTDVLASKVATENQGAGWVTRPPGCATLRP